jgi:hypothetical protein
MLNDGFHEFKIYFFKLMKMGYENPQFVLRIHKCIMTYAYGCNHDFHENNVGDIANSCSTHNMSSWMTPSYLFYHIM